MPRDFTVIYTHPRGATATFIYQGGEMSALAKGLDAEQFWVFKQVKALLLRNEEQDLALASRMMAEHGFTAQVSKPLPDLMAPMAPPRAVAQQAPPREYFFRPTPNLANVYPSFGAGEQVSEIHWREGETRPAVPPHRAPKLTIEAADVPDTTLVPPFQPQPASQVSEIHWREAQAHGTH